MKRSQLVNLILIPTLCEIPKGNTPEAVMAIEMIIAHESKGAKFITQLGGGPATGIIQMERLTHSTVWQYGDSVWKNALEMGIISPDDYKYQTHPDFNRLLYDLRYNIFMARQRLFMKPEALPNDATKMSAYLKRFWNSADGAARTDSYLKAYLSWK